MVRENRQFVAEFAEPYHHVPRSLHLDEILPYMLFEPRRIAYLRVRLHHIIYVVVLAQRAVEEFLHKRREQRMLFLRPIHFRTFYFQLMFFAQGDTRILDTGDKHLGEVENNVCDFIAHTYTRSEEHTSELQSQSNLVCRLLIEQK